MSSHPDPAPEAGTPGFDAAPPADSSSAGAAVESTDTVAPADSADPGVLADSAVARPRERGAGMLLAVFVSSIFLSAFLLFLVQPLFGRMVLPLLGGSPAVWNTCMLFFQAALLGGYLYAHLTSTRLGVRAQAAVHLALLAAAALALPVSVRGAAPEGGSAPIPWLLLLMLTTVGPPFLVLSGTGPILQRWFARSGHPAAADPYWLYAASNLGSMLALLGYPLLVEPRLRLAEQSGWWAAGYALLGLLIVGCAALLWRRPAASLAAAHPAAVGEGVAAPLAWRERAVWVGLAFVPSSMLLGATTYITTDLSPVPLLWVLPLALYLLSFTLVFARRQLLPHAWMLYVQVSVLAVLTIMMVSGLARSPEVAVPLHLAGLFVTAMVCHGELARRRPAVRHLTGFYLWMSVGGALGGVFNALLAPVLFTRVWEYPMIMVAACLARPWPRGATPRWHLWAALRAAGLAAAMVMLVRTGVQGGSLPMMYIPAVAVLIWLMAVGLGRAPLWLAACLGTVMVVRSVQQDRHLGLLYADRSFFGHYRVVEIQTEGGIHALYHGSTLHGAQARMRLDDPMTYYVRNGPLGQVMEATAHLGAARRVAVVGLGAGTTATYATPGEAWDIYEIDPGIERIARDRRLFTYLAESPARLRVVPGDARLSMARERGALYDLIVLDAFSSDAIPTHLMTREALGTYLERLAPGGLIAFHISNRYLDLEPVVAALADERRMAARISTGPRQRRGQYESTSTWVVLARRPQDLRGLATDGRWFDASTGDDIRLWTDDFSSVLSVFQW